MCRVLGVQVAPENRRNILADLLTVYSNAGKTIVFTQTKREADEVAAGIAGVIPSEVNLLPFQDCPCFFVLCELPAVAYADLLTEAAAALHSSVGLWFYSFRTVCCCSSSSFASCTSACILCE